MSHERRVCAYPITPDILLEMFKSMQAGEFITCDGLPFDARMAGVHYDILRNCWYFLVASDTFDVVPEGQIAPERFFAFTMNGTPDEWKGK